MMFKLIGWWLVCDGLGSIIIAEETEKHHFLLNVGRALRMFIGIYLVMV